MFIYVGNDYVIPSDQIISILNVELVHNSKKLQAIVKTKAENKQVLGDRKNAKSIIFTDEKIYYSPLSTLTLRNRDELYKTIPIRNA